MEEEILRLTQRSDSGLTAGSTKKAASTRSTGGIQVLKFGTDTTSGGAGEDHGSAWNPPSTGRRTLIGGFFTS